MKVRAGTGALLTGWLVLGGFFSQCVSQGQIEPLKVAFDGKPVVTPGTAQLVEYYIESGVSFTPIDSMSPGFVRVGSDPNPGRPDNGTSYLQAGLGSTLMFSFLDYSVFDMDSVDLAEYSTVVPDAVTVLFVGYRHDGSIVTTNMTTDGTIDGTGPIADFETFYFDDRFTSLDRVEIPTYGWSLDNLFVRPVPEPTSGALFLIGGLLFSWVRCRKSQIS